MKTLLIAINAKYEHEGLAVWYLKAACNKHDIPVTVMQFSINDSAQKIWASILGESPDVAAFSCYIWNREIVLRLINDLKKARPQCKIIVGGPEVSYQGSEKDYYAVGADYVVKGEGEGRFPILLKAIINRNIAGIKEILEAPGYCHKEDYISPFGPEFLARIKDRIAYIESSRGCPYRCSYCLSSESRSVVYYPISDIKDDIKKLVNAGAKVIKFVDRSFNVNEKRALAIWDFIGRFSEDKVTFHFEINPDILSKAQIDSLLGMPPGLVQIEAGIQSVNAKTLKEVSRVMNVDKAVDNLKILMSKGNHHIHVDLIAGLPYEDLHSFKESFNRIYQIRAHHLQLGFLKLLHGTRMRNEAEKHGYIYREYPPYEVISNKYISSEEMLILKGVEEVLDRTYNSGRFTFTLGYLEDYFSSSFDLYEGFAGFLKNQGRLYQPMSAIRLFISLREYALTVESIDPLTIDSLIALDYACSLKSTVIPDFLADSGVKSIDIRAILEEKAPERVWKKEYRKRYLVLEGNFPDKIAGKTGEYRNRIVVDMEIKDIIINRALPIPFDNLFTQV